MAPDAAHRRDRAPQAMGDRSRALEERRLHADHQHAPGRLAVIGKRSSSAGSTLIVARPFTRSVSPTPGIMNSNADARIREDVAQAVDAVVAAALGQQQRALVLHLDKAGRIAARRDIEAAGAGRQHRERGGRDHGLVVRVQRRHFLAGGGAVFCFVQRIAPGLSGNENE